MKRIIRNDRLTCIVIGGHMDEWDVGLTVEVVIKTRKPPIQFVPEMATAVVSEWQSVKDYRGSDYPGYVYNVEGPSNKS